VMSLCHNGNFSHIIGAPPFKSRHFEPQPGVWECVTARPVSEAALLLVSYLCIFRQHGIPLLC